MDETELLKQIERLVTATRGASHSHGALNAVEAQVLEFLRSFAGPKSFFLQGAREIHGRADDRSDRLVAMLQGFAEHVKAGLLDEISPARRAQLDTVCDFLEQAQQLLESNGVHPAAPIALIGATLEEFLRTWAETAGLDLGRGNPTLDVYAKALRGAELITKQDMKDVTSWAGLRNHAAHGEWEEVADKKRAAIMLEGVNLFMRKYGA